MERGCFSLWSLKDFSVKFGRGRLVKLWAHAGFANGFKQADRAEAGDFAGVFGNVKTHTHVRLSAEVVNFVRLYLPQDSVKRTRVVEVAVHQTQARPFLMRILVEMVDTIRVE